MDRRLSPVLRIASRLLEGRPASRELSEAFVETLALEPRLRFSTRLAMVRLTFAGLGATGAGSPHSMMTLARKLERLADQAEAMELAGLVALAPALLVLHQALLREHSPLSVVPMALLELMRSQLH
jgi:hypothetical protein